MENHTARDFALQLGALISLYVSLSFLLVLLFGIINVSFPNPSEGYYVIQSAQSSIRMAVAALVVFFPTYILLTRTVNRIRRLSGVDHYLVVTKWLVYLSLLAGGAVLLGDLVAVIMTFLEGDITTRFVLKALSVLFVVGAAFKYYLFDARGHWITHEGLSVIYGLVSFAVVLTSVAYGLVVIDSPAVVREMKLDEKEIMDLQDIQSRIQDHVYQTNGELPMTYEELYPADVPAAPEGRDAYEYIVTDIGFSLCATFGEASQNTDSMARSVPVIAEKGQFYVSQNWEHPAGRYCFERIISPTEETQVEATLPI